MGGTCVRPLPRASEQASKQTSVILGVFLLARSLVRVDGDPPGTKFARGEAARERYVVGVKLFGSVVNTGIVADVHRGVGGLPGEYMEGWIRVEPTQHTKYMYVLLECSSL